MQPTTRMSVRKREAELVRQRDALISRFAKRARRVVFDDDSETETAADGDGSETESDYEEPTRKARRIAAAMEEFVVETSGTDRVLTFLQSAQQQNTPVRSGKWNEDEEAYLRKLVTVFNLGILDNVDNKTSMRMWLAKMLHCCPMRISKKQMHGEKFKGKAKYIRNGDRIMRMQQREFDKTFRELHVLRSNFLKFWAKEAFGRWENSDRSRDFGKWYDTVLRNVPKPRLAKNDRLVEPIVKDLLEPWAVTFKDLEAAAREQDAKLLEREQKRRALRARTKKRVETPPPSVEQEVTTDCPDACCAAPPFEFTPDPRDNIFEPAPLEVEVDLATLVNEWEYCVPACTTPVKPIQEVHDTPRMRYQAQLSLSPGIVLDFGPPSMWDSDPISKDSNSPDHCGLMDDFLGDESLLTFDPAVVTPCDLPMEPWFQQLCTTFQL